MQLDSTFSVVAPIDTVWDTLMDFERVSGCVPGAQVLNKLSDDAYQVGMKVKLGPVSMQYKGLLNVIERDLGAHTAVFSGKAQETHGQGTAEATVTLQLVESAGSTTGTVSANVSLSGKAAAMGKGVITSVTDQMMALFAENLQVMVEASPTEPDRSVEEVSQIPSGDAEGAERLPAATPAPAATGARPAPARPANATAAPSLDALTLARGVITDQLSHPGKLLALLGAVAFIAYRLGRRGNG